MKALILVLFAVLIFGCSENPVNQTELIPAPADTLHFGIYQNYGYCDTQCVGQSVVLLLGKAISDRGYGYEYTVGNDSIWDGQLWLKNEGVFIDYTSGGTYSFRCETSDNLFYTQACGTQRLDVNCNQTYNITIQ